MHCDHSGFRNLFHASRGLTRPRPPRCHVCPSNAQLKCEVKGKNVRDAYAQCEYDTGVLSSGIDFQCPINDNTVECNWGYIRQQLPADNDRAWLGCRLGSCLCVRKSLQLSSPVSEQACLAMHNQFFCARVSPPLPAPFLPCRVRLLRHLLDPQRLDPQH